MRERKQGKTTAARNGPRDLSNTPLLNERKKEITSRLLITWHGRAGGQREENMHHLSKLQKTILILALSKNGDILTPAEVKAAYYGFPVRRKGKLWFRVPEIGFKRYRVAGVCVSRAFAALERKELVARSYTGIKLSEAGLAVAIK